MLAIAAKNLNIYTIVADPTPNCPAAQVADDHILGSFTDEAVIRELASKCDVLTVSGDRSCSPPAV
jgi:5-(carboxyamino)imidazole ribonucleotide synthase